jgi:5-methylcytosine-specific restriction endonuclease McrA
MINREMTKRRFGYDIDPNQRRRTRDDFLATNGVIKKELLVVDNCPICGIEREIKYSQSSKNKPCSKCFHNSDKMQEVKRNNRHIPSEETKQKMRDNHWSTKGITPAFKGMTHSKESRLTISKKAKQQATACRDADPQEYSKKMACVSRQISAKDFNGLITPENLRLRCIPELNAWKKNVLVKANFTCDRCGKRGTELHAHHLHSFSLHPDKRTDPNNGVCLCKSCHKEFHSKYSLKKSTADDYHSFKSEPRIDSPLSITPKEDE